MVQRLRAQYKSKEYTSREVLWRTLSRTSLDSCKNMTEWVETIKKVKVSLMELDSTIPQWIVTTTFLHALPSSYDSFVEIIINARGKDANGRPLEPEFDDVCERVLDRERRQKILASDHSNSKALKAAGKANSANSNSKSNSKPKSQRPRSKCDECGSMHGGDCYLANPDKASDGWRKANKERIDEFRKKRAGKKEKGKMKKACCAINVSTKDPGFFFDSAASLHYTYSMAWYHEDPTQNPGAVMFWGRTSPRCHAEMRSRRYHKARNL